MFQTKSYHRCLRILPAILLAITCSSCGAEPKKGEAQQPEDAHRIAAPVSSANATEVAPKLEPVLEKVAATSPAEASVSLPNDANFTSTPFAPTPSPPEAARMEIIKLSSGDLVTCLTVNKQPVGYGTIFTGRDISVTRFSGNKLAGLRISLLPQAPLDRPVGALEIANVDAENKPIGPVYSITPGILLGDPFILSEVNANGKPHGEHLQINDDGKFFSTSFNNGERSEKTTNGDKHTLKTGEHFFTDSERSGQASVGWQRKENGKTVYRGLYVNCGHPAWEIAFYGADGKTEGDSITFMLTPANNLVIFIAPAGTKNSNGKGWKIHPNESIQYGEFSEGIPAGKWLLYDNEIKVVSQLTPFFAPIGDATIYYNNGAKSKSVQVGAEGLGAHL